jgi:peptide deformylase (EC 3.5.1.88)
MKEELKLRIYGDPVLREKSTPVEKFDEDLKETIKKMAELMYKVKGLGLAANQWVSLKIFHNGYQTKRRERPSLKFT